MWYTLITIRLSVILLILCTSLCGCATFSESYKNTYHPTSYGFYYYSYEVNIISDPPGARIEWNDNSIGKAPLTQILNGSCGLLSITTIKAYPVTPGQYVQRKTFFGDTPIPKTIYFDMNLVPVPQSTINVNIDH